MTPFVPGLSEQFINKSKDFLCANVLFQPQSNKTFVKA